MRKLLAVLALSFSATTAFAMPAPTNHHPRPTWTRGELQAIDNWLDRSGDQFEDWFYATWGPLLGLTDPDSGHSGSSGGGGTVAAPELDPAAALAALTLLTGGLAVLRGRRSKR